MLTRNPTLVFVQLSEVFILDIQRASRSLIITTNFIAHSHGKWNEINVFGYQRRKNV